MLKKLWRGLTGQLDQGAIERQLNAGMSQYTNPMTLNAQTLAGKGNELMDFSGATNVASRELLQDAAADATATGGLQAAQMAAQQGMGGSGLLQQAQANNAFTNMMKANRFGLQDTMKNFRLGGDYLNQSSNIFQNLGSMQGDNNETLAMTNMHNQNAQNKFIQGAAGTLIGALPGGGGGVEGVLSSLLASKGP